MKSKEEKMHDGKYYRGATEKYLTTTLDRILKNYMEIYDEYYDTLSKETDILKEVADSILGVDAILNVYTRYKGIHPSFAIEKLNLSINKLEGAKEYYEAVLKEMNEEEVYRRSL